MVAATGPPTLARLNLRQSGYNRKPRPVSVRTVGSSDAPRQSARLYFHGLPSVLRFECHRVSLLDAESCRSDRARAGFGLATTTSQHC